MNVNSYNFSKDSLSPYFYQSKSSNKSILIFSNDKDALDYIKNYKNFSTDVDYLPSWDTLTYDSFIPSLEIQGERLELFYKIITKNKFHLVTSIKAISQKIFFSHLEVIEIIKNEEVDFDSFIQNLIHLKYVNKDRVEANGTFSVRGGQIDVYPINHKFPIRIIFDGDEVVEIKQFDSITQRSIDSISSALIVPASELFQFSQLKKEGLLNLQDKKEYDEYEIFQFSQNIFVELNILNLIDQETELNFVNFESCKNEILELQQIEKDTFKNLQKYFSINITSFSSRYLDFESNFKNFPINIFNTNDLSNLEHIPEYLNGMEFQNSLEKLKSCEIVYLASSNNKIHELFNGIDNLKLVPGSFTFSAIFRDLSVAIIDESLFSQRKTKKLKPKNKKINEEFMLVPNTYIVHQFHGIGLYEGTEVKNVQGVEKDYLSIKFGGSDKLFVPSDQINELEVYIGGENPKLSRLGGAEWERAKEKARLNAKIIADRVLALYKLRKIVNNDLMISEDTPWQTEIESNFEFIETPDQLTAIDDVKKDLEKNIPMDRLIFGDVGYGKTEVALRAAIKVAFSGAQVAILAPTTILVQQHIETFSKRLESYPLTVKHLSRFVKKNDIKKIIKGVKEGTVDILIGTHRILSDDIQFKNLKLIIIDEEHRFGVEDKDKLQSLSTQVHKLTLTATPIPRTLEQSLMGIRETSRLDTPPENRLETLTHVGYVDDSALALAIQRETIRGGQVFFVLNRITELQEWMKKIYKQFPKLRHSLLHGQLSSDQIETTMQQVWDHEIDVLFATTIVEAGIDLPKVNTLISLRSELLGMSQLYQLKGRVGRRNEQSFAYFFHSNNLGTDAELRLDAIKSTGQTATGYSLAMKDLQLRGSGSILGDIQSGFIANVGLNIFNQYVLESLDKSIETIKVMKKSEIKLDCFWGASIPRKFIEADSERIDLYKRLEHSNHLQVDQIKIEIIDRFGELPEITENLFITAKIRNLLATLSIEKCMIKDYQIELFPINLTNELNQKLKKIDKKFIFRNKRLVLHFKNALTPSETYDFLNSNLAL